jgi:hypothetical protein
MLRIIIPGTTTAEFFWFTNSIALPCKQNVWNVTVRQGMEETSEFRLGVESDLYVGMIEVVEADHKRVRETH